MAIADLATEAKATALITAARTCLAQGTVPTELIYSGGLGGFLKDVISQLQSVTVNDVTARTDVTPDDARDGRDATEAALT